MRYLILFILLFTFRASMALEVEVLNTSVQYTNPEGKPALNEIEQEDLAKIEAQVAEYIRSQSLNPLSVQDIKRRSKLGVVVMAILTGPLGGHRLYLGTKPYVPIIYALTLGGGFGLLPLIDIVVVLTSKDISEFENNDHIMMWADL